MKAIWLVVSMSLLLGCNRGPDASAHEEGRGPHGGRLLGEPKAMQAEVAIFESGVPPEFHVWITDKGKPVRPAEVTLSARIERLGGKVDQVRFEPAGDYLRGLETVREPHSFDVTFEAVRAGGTTRWSYSQLEGRTAMPDDVMANADISVEPAGPAPIRISLELPGETRLNADRVSHVVARLPGVVVDVRKKQGDRVAKGEVIAVLESRELASAKQDFLETAQRAKFASAALAREKTLHEKGVSAEADLLEKKRAFEQAELEHRTARQKLAALGVSAATLDTLLGEDRPLNRLELRAPFDGTVIEKEVAVGQAVEGDAHLFTLADLGTIWVDVTVYAKDLGLVKVGQPVTVASTDLGAEASGKIEYVGAVVDTATRSTTARVVLANEAGEWRPGLFVTARIVRVEENVPLAVKREALQTFRDWDVVFARHGEHFEVRPLTLGRRDEHWVEVLAGLDPGERYAVANSYVVKADIEKAGATHDH